jgi:hypothetical protein
MDRTITFTAPHSSVATDVTTKRFVELSDLYRRVQDVTWRDGHGNLWTANYGAPNTLSNDHRRNLIEWLFDRAEALYQLHLAANMIRRLSNYDIRAGGIPRSLEVEMDAVEWMENTPLMRALLQTRPLREPTPWLII